MASVERITIRVEIEVRTPGVSADVRAPFPTVAVAESGEFWLKDGRVAHVQVQAYSNGHRLPYSDDLAEGLESLVGQLYEISPVQPTGEPASTLPA